MMRKKMVEYGLRMNNVGRNEEVLPSADTQDFNGGALFIPGEVTLARRKGEYVAFYQPCSNPCCWYWQFPNGSRTYHFERYHYERIADRNGKVKSFEGIYPDGVGNCPDCGNPRVRGCHMMAEEVDSTLGLHQNDYQRPAKEEEWQMYGGNGQMIWYHKGK